jgi:hypothetical protein
MRPASIRRDRSIVGAVYDRALFLESTNTRGHRPRLQKASGCGKNSAFGIVERVAFGLSQNQTPHGPGRVEKELSLRKARRCWP